MDTSSRIQTAKLIAVPLPWVLAGYSLAFSQNAVPTIYDVPAEVATPVFKQVYHRGAQFVVPGAAVLASAAGYLAYVLPHQRTQWGVAAVGGLMPIAFTALVMNGGIQRLLTISGNKTMQEKATANLEHRQLLIRWVKQNYVRAIINAAVGVVTCSLTRTDRARAPRTSWMTCRDLSAPEGWLSRKNDLPNAAQSRADRPAYSRGRLD